MLNQRNREQNFIEKRRQWKSKVDKPLSRRMLIMILPALVLSVFVMMSAPYLKIMVEEFMRGGESMSFPMELDLTEKKVVEKAGPPPNPDTVLQEELRAELNAEGFDWGKDREPVRPEASYAQERELAIEPLEVELPNTMTELRARVSSEETPSE